MTTLMTHSDIRRALLRGETVPQVFGPDRPLMAHAIYAVTSALLLTADEQLQAALLEPDNGPLNRRRLGAIEGRRLLANVYRGYHPPLPEIAQG